jgi:malate dehydrogenase (oxaloacetate-decarboxylating)
VGKELSGLRIVLQGAGAAGVAISNLLLAAGVTDIIVIDREGIIEQRRKGTDPIRRRLAKQTNPREVEGHQADALQGADVFVGVSGPNSLSIDNVRRMASDPIIFALANPTPEIMPEDVAGDARIVATGRSDYPNQINNVLCFPGLFRGLLDAAATTVTDEMKITAAEAIANIVGGDASEDYIIPSPFDRSVAPAVAMAVTETARRQGLIRPGSHGSLEDEVSAHAAEAARAAVDAAATRRRDAAAANPDTAEGVV